MSGKFFLDPFFRVIWNHFLSTVQLAVVVVVGSSRGKRDAIVQKGVSGETKQREQKIF